MKKISFIVLLLIAFLVLISCTEQILYYLQTTIEGNGIIEIISEKEKYSTGEVIQLKAVPDEGWEFDHWEGDLTGSDNPKNIKMNSNKTVTAIFTEIIPETYTLTINITGNGSVDKSPDKIEYSEGEIVELTANASPGWYFDHWEGDLTGSDNPKNITMNSNKTVIAIFTENIPETYTLTINITGNGSVDKSPDKTEYNEEEIVELTANASPGWEFDHWEGDLSGNDNSKNITMNSNKTVIAIFTEIIPETYTLTINITGNGSVDKSPDKTEYNEEEIVELTANASPGWEFDHWEVDLTGSDNPENITMNSNKTVTAIFTEIIPETYTLTINITGNGSVDKSPDKIEYSEGEIVELTANASPGWEFDHWEVDLTGSDNPENIEMDSNKTITAVFTEVPPETYTLTINITGNGSVDKSPDKAEYNEGEIVELTANASPGWYFDHWDDDLTGSDNPENIEMDSNKTITAVFTEVPPETYTLSINITGNGSVDKFPDKVEYNEGEIVEVTANASPGWYFDHWDDDLTGSDNPENITIDSDKTVTAVFLEENVLPQIIKVDGPESEIPYNYTVFEWLGTDTDGTIESYDYRKEGGAWINISSTEYIWTGLEEGSHDFEVRARDNRGDFSNIIIWNFDYVISTPRKVKVDNGTFTMGDTLDVGEVNEKPEHPVILSYDFHIGKYEVTNKEYCTFLNDYGVNPDGYIDGKLLIDLLGACFIEHNGTYFYVEEDLAEHSLDDYPVVQVTWWGAIYYCNWLSGIAGLADSYNLSTGELINYPNNTGFRLPTEAEWEYAARGAANIPDYLYSGSDDLDLVGWYYDNSDNPDLPIRDGKSMHEIGLKNPNVLNIYDMSGNVYEWCNDWYGEDYYSTSPSVNPVGESSGTMRIVKGGCFFANSEFNRVTCRNGSEPDQESFITGFRICRTFQCYNVPPDIEKISGPDDEVFEDSQSFVWLGSDSDGTVESYEYRKNGGSWVTTYNTYYTWDSIAEGTNTFEVRAKDNEGKYSIIVEWYFKYIYIPLPVKEMIYVPSGTFNMGDTKDAGNPYEKPVHSVTITYDFFISNYEVTNQEYCAFLNIAGIKSNGYKDGKQLIELSGACFIEHNGTYFYVQDDLAGNSLEDYPVVQVTWWGAIYYCNWRSGVDGYTPVYDLNTGEMVSYPTSDGYRLPTEAEWEYAARSATNAPDYLYSGSDNLDSVGWFYDNSYNSNLPIYEDKGMHRIGLKNPNALSIYDMSGNVAEWCYDWYDNYPTKPVINPTGLASGIEKIVRGGGFVTYSDYCRVSRRDRIDPVSYFYCLGFRICRTDPDFNFIPSLEKINGPDEVINENEQTFEWLGSDVDGTIAGYEYRKDGGSWIPTNNTNYTWTSIKESSHTFEVRAKDNEGKYSTVICWSFEYILITHTVTLEYLDSYGFYTFEITQTGGDMYYNRSSYDGLNKFFANNIGQSPMIDMGEIPFDAKINPPSDGYSRYGHEAIINHVYISQASQGVYNHVIFIVIDIIDDTVTIEYFPTKK